MYVLCDHLSYRISLLAYFSPLLSPLHPSFSTVLKIMSFIAFGPFTILERSFAFSRSLSPSLGARREGRQRSERKRILSKERKREREREREKPFKEALRKGDWKVSRGLKHAKTCLVSVVSGWGGGAGEACSFVTSSPCFQWLFKCPRVSSAFRVFLKI